MKLEGNTQNPGQVPGPLGTRLNLVSREDLMEMQRRQKQRIREKYPIKFQYDPEKDTITVSDTRDKSGRFVVFLTKESFIKEYGETTYHRVVFGLGKR